MPIRILHQQEIESLAGSPHFTDATDWILDAKSHPDIDQAVDDALRSWEKAVGTAAPTYRYHSLLLDATREPRRHGIQGADVDGFLVFVLASAGLWGNRLFGLPPGRDALQHHRCVPMSVATQLRPGPLAQALARLDRLAIEKATRPATAPTPPPFRL